MGQPESKILKVIPHIGHNTPSEHFVQAGCVPQLLKVRVPQSLQMAHLTVLRQPQWSHFPRRLGEVNDHLACFLLWLNRADRCVVSRLYSQTARHLGPNRVRCSISVTIRSRGGNTIGRLVWDRQAVEEGTRPSKAAVVRIECGTRSFC